MYSPSAFTSMGYWSSEKTPFSTADSSTENALPTSSGSSGRSCSPPDLQKPMDNGPFQFESVFNQPQQSLSMHRGPSSYQRQQQVSYLPETVNSTWATLSQQGPVAYTSNHCPPKRFVFEVPHCCATPRIRVFHECCSKESTPREIPDDRAAIPRRNFPPTSKLTLCRFCLKNGEPPSVYYSHNLHAEDGRVSCPVLRRYDCPICQNGGGDYAHTVRYCPRLRAGIVR